MKGEFSEDQDDSHNHHHHHHNNHQQHHHHHHHHNAHPHHHNMFSKFPPPHLHTQPPKFQTPQSHYPSHPFPLTTTPKDSEEADSGPTTTTPTPPSSKKPKTTATTTTTTASEDGGTIEVARRPRGRPPGSKNKPKPPIVITREPEPGMAPYILEVPGGSDIVDSLTRFTRRRGVGLCVLNASGAVANVSLKQPSTAAPGGTVTFHGRFDILSLSAVLLLQTVPFSGNNNNNNSSNSGSSNGGNNNNSSNNNNGGFTFTFTISLAGPQGQIVGGKVVGPLLAAGTVYIIAASFSSPSYHRLPIEDQEVQNQNPSSGGGCGGDRQSSSPVSGGGDGGGGGGGPMGLYSSCQMGSDVIWAPTARPPPPY